MSNAKSTTGRGMRKLMGDGNGWDDQGGYMQAKIRKLEKQFTTDRPIEIQRQKSSSDIFSGIAIFVNGYTIPSSDELKKLMLQHGGMYHHYYARTKVTHIIASNLPNSKIDKIHDKKIVKPEWITDSVKAEKCLPFENYLLYTARSTVQPGLHRFASNTSMSSTLSATSIASEASLEANDDTTVKSGEKSSLENGHGHKAEEPAASAKLNDISVNSSKTSKFSPNTENRSRIPAKPGDPGFVAEFYNHSRLHYLSTWGAEFRVYVNELHAKGGNTYPGRDRLKSLMETNGFESDARLPQQPKLMNAKTNRVIMHIDMDCFFVSVGLRNRPDLVGKPVVVTHSRGKGVKERPGTDVEYERQHYRNKAIEKKAKKLGIDLEGNPDMKKIVEDEGFEEEESEKDDQDIDDADNKETYRTHAAAVKETFNSMSEIASASYEARKAGIKNGMFMGPAKQLCPELVTIPYDFTGYREVSQKLYDTVASYTHDIEAVSCDEMLVDLTDVLNETGASALQFATILRKEIFEKTQCTASVGIGPSILAAKLATKKAKPNGQFYIDPEDVNAFILDKVVRDLPGVGWATSRKLQDMNVKTCEDLQRLSLAALQKEFGPKTGQSLYRACRGQDDRAIKIEKERKSVSAEINYGIRFSQESEVNNFIAQVSEEVHDRMDKIKVKGKTITLKLKIRAKHAPVETAKFLGHGICDSVTKSITLPVATDSTSIIHKECMGIIKALHIPPSEYRGVGIQMSKLESTEESSTLTAKGLQSILNFASKIEKDKETPEPAKQTTNGDNASVASVSVRSDSEVDVDTDRRRHPSLPPLPSLPDLNISGSSQDTPKTPKATVREMQGSVPKEELYLPSPSQVDLDVLKELPADIRQQIEQDIRINKRKRLKETNSVNSPFIVLNADSQTLMCDNSRDIDGAQPGCSKWEQKQITNAHQDQDTVVTETGKEKDIILIDEDAHRRDMQTNGPFGNDLSFSQLDKTVLAALPPEIRREVEAEYQQRSLLNGHVEVMQV